MQLILFQRKLYLSCEDVCDDNFIHNTIIIRVKLCSVIITTQITTIFTLQNSTKITL